MVRRNELACRDEWSRSLWQPRDREHADGGMPLPPPVPGPLPPALAENLHAVLNGDSALAASPQGEDVLLSEARIVSEADEPWQQGHRHFPTGHFDPRTAIFRAREAYRERVRTKAAAERQSAGLEAMIGPPSVAEFPAQGPEEILTNAGERVQPERDANAAEEFLFQSDEIDQRFNELAEERPLVDEPVRPSAAPVSATMNRNVELPIDEESNLAEAQPERATAGKGEQSRGPARKAPLTEETDFGNALVESAEGEALPDWYRADLPRICRTCRDYRPSAEGQRGWCANTWAFTHRRLVLEDDAAPCQSAIGDWWLPVDDVWLVAADVSSHGRATPLLDRQTAKADQQRRRS